MYHQPSSLGHHAMTRSVTHYWAILLAVILLMAAGDLGSCEPSGNSEAGRYVDTTVVPCDQLGTWSASDLASKDKSLRISIIKVGDRTRTRSVLELRSSRLAGSAPSLVTMVPLTDFSAITFDAWSENDTIITALFQDSDKRSFHAVTPMKAGVWQKISLTPRDFQVNDDAPIKKQSVEPLKLRMGMLITDMGSMMGKSGPNSIRIVGLEIKHEPLDVVNLPSVLDGRTLEISANSILSGNTVIRNGGSIKISAARAILNGNIMMDKGSLEFRDTALTMKSRFAHERTIAVCAGSTIKFTRCAVISDQAIGLQVSNGSRLEVDQTERSAAGWTVGVDKGACVEMSETKQFGEFIVSAGAQFKVRDSESFIIWLVSAGTTQVDLSLPSDPVIAGWRLPEQDGFGIDLQNCSGIKWGLISAPGTKVKVSNSRMLAVGLLFAGNTKQTMVCVRNKQPAAKLRFPASDRLLEFDGRSVGAWNFYAYGSSDINLKNCAVGEAFTVENSKMTLDACIVDGTGGYVKASGHSLMRLLKSETTCNVVADQDAILEIGDSTIAGSLSAAGSAKVSFKRSRVTGLISKLDRAKIAVSDEARKKPGAKQ